MSQQPLLQRCRSNTLRLIALICLWCVSPIVLVAATNSHNIEVGVLDTVVPTAPSNLAASVSGLQVTLVWDESVDDQAVDEYLIFIDGVLTTRTGSTSVVLDLGSVGTFTLGVQAIDFGDNLSPLAAVAATTVNQSSGGGGGGGSRGDSGGASSVTVSLEDGMATLTISLTEIDSVSVRYGRSADYELGEITNPGEALTHTVILPFLYPGETYFYQVRTHNDNVVIEIGSFTAVGSSPGAAMITIALTDASGAVIGTAVTRADFSDYVIVLNTTRPPLHRFDGQVVYRGRSLSPRITDLRDGFYGIFFRDALENVVDGQIVRTEPSGGDLPLAGPAVAGIGWSDRILISQSTSVGDEANLQNLDASQPLTVTVPTAIAPFSDGAVAVITKVGSEDPIRTTVLSKHDSSGSWQTSIVLPPEVGLYELTITFFSGQEITTQFATPLTVTAALEEERRVHHIQLLILNLLQKAVSLLQMLISLRI